MKRGSKLVTLNIRAPKMTVELIDRAAETTFRSRTEFMLTAAAERAKEVILAHAGPDLPDEIHSYQGGCRCYKQDGSCPFHSN